MEFMRIGILGGSFDPVHSGHISLAKKALIQLKLDVLFFLPAYIAPHKKRGIASASDRRNMIRLAVSGIEKFSISDEELKKRSKRYTYRTLGEFKKKYPGSRLFFIIGSDSAADFEKWKRPNEIREFSTVAVGVRAGHDFKKCGFVLLKGNIRDISSTAIRDRIKRGLPLKGFVPLAVENYIRKNNLYF